MSDPATFELDTEHQIAYVKLDDGPVVRTVHGISDIHVDFDADGFVVGIEILNLP